MLKLLLLPLQLNNIHQSIHQLVHEKQYCFLVISGVRLSRYRLYFIHSTIVHIELEYSADKNLCTRSIVPHVHEHTRIPFLPYLYIDNTNEMWHHHKNPRDLTDRKSSTINLRKVYRTEYNGQTSQKEQSNNEAAIQCVTIQFDENRHRDGHIEIPGTKQIVWIRVVIRI